MRLSNFDDPDECSNGKCILYTKFTVFSRTNGSTHVYSISHFKGKNAMYHEVSGRNKGSHGTLKHNSNWIEHTRTKIVKISNYGTSHHDVKGEDKR